MHSHQVIGDGFSDFATVRAFSKSIGHSTDRFPGARMNAPEQRRFTLAAQSKRSRGTKLKSGVDETANGHLSSSRNRHCSTRLERPRESTPLGHIVMFRTNRPMT